MQSQSFPLIPPLAEQQQQGVESLNLLLDPISFLTESEMQQDLDFFANTQFSHDVPPASVLDGSCCWGNDCHSSDNSHGNGSNLYCYHTTSSAISHHHSNSALSSPTATTLFSETTTGPEDDYRHSKPKHAQEQQQHQPKLTKDDKRKRNTAASARFRIKKKMREQALQRTAFEMTEKSKRMEAHIQDLEREIKWLKALVVEKSEGGLAKLVSERPIPTARQYTPAPYPPANSMSLPQQDLLHSQEDDDDDDYN